MHATQADLFLFLVLDLYRCNAGADDAQLAGSLFRKIYNATLGIGPAVVDAHFYRTAIGKVDHFNFGAKCKGAVCGCHVVLPEDLSAGGTAAIKLICIVRGFSGFCYFTGTGTQAKNDAC